LLEVQTAFDKAESALLAEQLLVEHLDTKISLMEIKARCGQWVQYGLFCARREVVRGAEGDTEDFAMTMDLAVIAGVQSGAVGRDFVEQYLRERVRLKWEAGYASYLECGDLSRLRASIPEVPQVLELTTASAAVAGGSGGGEE
jgi:hypothetical protein